MGGGVFEKLIEHTQKFRQRYATAPAYVPSKSKKNNHIISHTIIFVFFYRNNFLLFSFIITFILFLFDFLLLSKFLSNKQTLGKAFGGR